MSLFSTLRYVTSHPLNRHRPLQSIGAYIKWQIGSRLALGPAVVPFIKSSRLLVSRGMKGATGNIYCGLHEFEEMAFLLHFLRPGDLFVDVGANIGSCNILASAVIGAESIAFEPIPVTFGHLMKNIDINGVNHLVSARNVGLAASTGQLKFTGCLDTVNHVATEDEKSTIETVTVPVETLDNMMAEKMPQLLKIDVEGFETSVIDDASRVLSNKRLSCVIMELNGSGTRYGFDEAVLHKRIMNFGFSPCSYKLFNRKLEELNGQHSSSGNTIYIRDMAFVASRIASAPAIQIHGLEI